MKKLLLSVAATTLISVNAMAGAVIIDHGNYRDMVQNFITERTFDEAFAVGDKALTQHNECVYDQDGNEECTSTYSKWEITKKEKDLVHTSTGDTVTRDLYNHYKGNYFELLLEAIASNPIIEKAGITNTDNLTVELTGSYRHFDWRLGVNVVEVSMEFKTETEDGDFVFPIYVIVAQEVPTFAQIVEIGLGEFSDSNNLTPFSRVLSYTKK